MLRFFAKNVHQNEQMTPPPHLQAPHSVPEMVIFGSLHSGSAYSEVLVKVQIEALGLPTLSKLIGKKSQFEMPEGTVADLVARLVDRSGGPARKILLDQSGQLDLSIQVMINDEGFLPRSHYAQRVLKEGDAVKFMLLVGGG
jgi:sulfur carrier protein ThiS